MRATTCCWASIRRIKLPADGPGVGALLELAPARLDGVERGRQVVVALALDSRAVADRGRVAHASGRTKNATTAYWRAAAAITSAWKTSW